MKCSKAHQQIYLFSELNHREREELLLHIGECEACRKLADSMKFVNNVIARIAKVQTEPADENKLTNSIMSCIRTVRQPVNRFEQIKSNLEFKPIKWAMAGVSICLVFVLAIEQFRSFPEVSSPSARVEPFSSHKTILNSKHYQDELRKYSSTQRASFITRCNDPFNITKYNVACLKERIVRLKSL